MTVSLTSPTERLLDLWVWLGYGGVVETQNCPRASENLEAPEGYVRQPSIASLAFNKVYAIPPSASTVRVHGYMAKQFRL